LSGEESWFRVNITLGRQRELQGSKANGVMRLHHVGFVVPSILDEIANLAESIGAYWDETVWHDPLQKATVAFLRTSSADDALIELVEPAAEGSPVVQFLHKGGGLHHLCYEVEDLGACLKTARISGSVVVRRPRPAVAFGNRRVAWVLTRQKLLLEYLERNDSNKLPWCCLPGGAEERPCG
jgi:methylmalonyl-CoA/ethylmalonyl-CoA epimerase